MALAPAPSSLDLTPEQEAIVSHEPTSNLIVHAYAGTGKTSTLVEFARRWSSRRGLYLAFNSAIGREAQAKFPRNVEVRTMHAYAYRALGIYEHQDRLQPGAIRRQQIRDAAAAALGEGTVLPTPVVVAISRAFRRFLISDAERLLPEHVPALDSLPWKRGEVLRAAVKTVRHLMSFRENGGPFNHDMYLKAFALDQQKSPARPPYDVVLVDEAQDLSPVMIGIVSRFRVPLIVVGDTYQSIYAFRGAVSAMGMFEGPTLPLTQSWRFGPAVAAAANQILELTSKPPRLPVRGNPGARTTVHEGTAERGAILARTNARLMELLMEHVDTPFYIAGGYHQFRREIEAGIDLWLGRPPSDASPLPYKDRDELEVEAKDGDPVAARLVKLLTEHGTDELSHMLARLVACAKDRPQDAVLYLSTAHKAKGLEFAATSLLDDFWSLDRRVSYRDYLQRESKWTPAKERDFDQELNLLYVAITRAKERLYLPSELFYELAPGH